MNPYIHLKREEYDEVDEGVRALVSTVIKKLPPPARKKYQALEDENQAAGRHDALVQAGVDSQALAAWLNGNVSASATGRSWRVIVSLYDGLAELVRDMGAPAVNAALKKILSLAAAEKCTLPYLKAVLRSASTLPQPEVRRQPVNVGAAPGQPDRAGRDIWEAVRAGLRAQVGDHHHRTWIDPLEFLRVEQACLVLGVPDSIFGDFIRRNFARTIRTYWQACGGGVLTAIQYIPDDM